MKIIICYCTPPPSNSTTSIITCLLGNPNLNLHSWLASWLGGRSNLYMSYNSFVSNSWTRFILQPSQTDPSDSQHHVVLSFDQPARQFSKPALQSYLASDRLVERLSFLKLHTLKQGQISEDAPKKHCIGEVWPLYLKSGASFHIISTFLKGASPGVDMWCRMSSIDSSPDWDSTKKTIRKTWNKQPDGCLLRSCSFPRTLPLIMRYTISFDNSQVQWQWNIQPQQRLLLLPLFLGKNTKLHINMPKFPLGLHATWYLSQHHAFLSEKDPPSSGKPNRSWWKGTFVKMYGPYCNISHRIHGTNGIFTYMTTIYKNQPFM